MKTFLMCPPDFFNVSYEINPHMVGNINTVDVNLAKEQWEKLRLEISKIANVELLTPVDGLPDMVFVANAAVVNPYSLKALVSTFSHPQRQGETEHFARWFRDDGWDTTVSAEVFEGAGDCLYDKYDNYWFGYGQRSSLEAKQQIDNLMTPTDLTELKLIDPRWYHLDTCFCPLDTGYYLGARSAFSEESWEYMSYLVEDRLIEVEDEDAMAFACNAVSIGKTIIMPNCSDKLINILTNAGHNVITLDMSEFLKSGGACKCLILEL